MVWSNSNGYSPKHKIAFLRGFLSSNGKTLKYRRRNKALTGQPRNRQFPLVLIPRLVEYLFLKKNNPPTPPPNQTRIKKLFYKSKPALVTPNVVIWECQAGAATNPADNRWQETCNAPTNGESHQCWESFNLQEHSWIFYIRQKKYPYFCLWVLLIHDRLCQKQLFQPPLAVYAFQGAWVKTCAINK